MCSLSRLVSFSYELEKNLDFKTSKAFVGRTAAGEGLLFFET